MAPYPHTQAWGLTNVTPSPEVHILIPGTHEYVTLRV